MTNNIEPSLLDFFLIIYFYQLETDLNKNNKGLEKIEFQSDEANTDKYVKRFFQNYILDNNNISSTNFENITVIIDKKDYVVKTGKLQGFKITSALLPEQLSPSQKKVITNSKKSVYTNPDLYLEISNGKNTFFESLELKSTKNNTIPGSSVQQVAPFEWVIFVKRNRSSVEVSTGYYINSITEKLPFPDRSPRPIVGFKTLYDWNRKYRIVESDELIIRDTSEINQKKIKLLADWQDFLAAEWLEIIKADDTKKNEKWFNNAIRKFALKFLNYSDQLSHQDKEVLKRKLNKLIK